MLLARELCGFVDRLVELLRQVLFPGVHLRIARRRELVGRALHRVGGTLRLFAGARTRSARLLLTGLLLTCLLLTGLLLTGLLLTCLPLPRLLLPRLLLTR
ncbi:MAG TPA: hypothetical protein PKE51_11935, partial [Gemmatimonadaceae bacterium]|nr:hypothetical protein [Gemmatimonadaceae bacterium]